MTNCDIYKEVLNKPEVRRKIAEYHEQYRIGTVGNAVLREEYLRLKKQDIGKMNLEGLIIRSEKMNHIEQSILMNVLYGENNNGCNDYGQGVRADR